MTNTNKRIEEIKNQLFYLKMKDHWSFEDSETIHKLNYELFQLENAELFEQVKGKKYFAIGNGKIYWTYEQYQQEKISAVS